jgi:hypothetical protein
VGTAGWWMETVALALTSKDVNLQNANVQGIRQRGYSDECLRRWCRLLKASTLYCANSSLRVKPSLDITTHAYLEEDAGTVQIPAGATFQPSCGGIAEGTDSGTGS